MKVRLVLFFYLFLCDEDIGVIVQAVFVFEYYEILSFME